MNEAYILKLARKVGEEPAKLWISVLQGKYGRNCNWRSEIKMQNANSKLWKDIV